MDTFDYQRSSVPARMPSQRATSPAVQRYEAHGAESAPSPLSVKSVFRAARRYWWLIIALWTVGTAGIGAAVYLKVRPVYRASSWLEVKPTAIDLFDTGRGSEPYLQNYVTLIKSANVLSRAAEEPAVMAVPRIRNAKDATQELNGVIGVGVLPGTYIIEVAMASPSATEAATLVNAVVDSFLEENTDWSTGAMRAQIDKLKAYKLELQADIRSREEEIKTKIAREGRVVEIAPAEAEEKDDRPGRRKAEFTVSDYQRMLQNFNDITIELMTEEARLAEAENVVMQSRAEAEATGGRRASGARVELSLKNDPDLLGLAREMMKVKQTAEKIHEDSRGSGDPAELKARRNLVRLNKEYRTLLEQKRDHYEAQLVTNPGAGTPEQEVSQISQIVKNLRIKKDSYERELGRLKVENNKQQGDEMDIRFRQEELSSQRQLLNIVHKKYETLEFDSTAVERIKRITTARAEGSPIGDKRTQYMAMAPVGVLGAVLALVILLEIRSGRVGDTEVLAARMRHEVFSIAPLPSLRAGLGTDGSKAEQRLARFVQSLDHLRVALCEGGMEGEGRCVMITSATGGEGKTTLSAHLAARCANAGTSTLLIDADLRRASLGRLLDVPPGPGLGDVLAGTVELDPSLLTVQGGGFYFLSAGSPGIDPTRVLKSTRLAELIGQLRQMYDLIIIDTPPVLPVADALIMGRWADGAVMAARYDASRLPLVERANRQIIAAGIPVLGVVVNGVKAQDQAYGSYSYGYAYPGRHETVDAADLA